MSTNRVEKADPCTIQGTSVGAGAGAGVGAEAGAGAAAKTPALPPPPSTAPEEEEEEEEEEGEEPVDETKADKLLFAPSEVPTGTGTTLHLHEDPTFARFEKFVQLHPVPAPEDIFPLEFQTLPATVEENPFQRKSDVAAFRRGTFQPDFYREHAAMHVRPRNGMQYQQNNDDDATDTHVRLVGCTALGHKVAVFVRYSPWLQVKRPQVEKHREALESLLDRLPALLRVSDDQVTVTPERRYPLCGWQPEPDVWLRVDVPSQAALKHTKNLLFKLDFQVNVAMHDRTLQESLKSVLVGNHRPCSWIRVNGGTIVSLDQQQEHVDIEIHDADIECIHFDDSGDPPPVAAFRLGSWDLELNCREKNTKMVNVQREESRVTQCSFVIRRRGGWPGGPAAAAARPQEIARFLISIYPAEESPAYTLIRVEDEIGLMQARRRLIHRFRLTCLLGHNTDGFDTLTLRRRLMLLTDPYGSVCWFYDHPAAGGGEHNHLRRNLNVPRERAFNKVLDEELAFKEAARLKRIRDKKARGGDFQTNERSKEPMGLWAPLDFVQDSHFDRIIVFNLKLLFAEMRAEDGCMDPAVALRLTSKLIDCVGGAKVWEDLCSTCSEAPDPPFLAACKLLEMRTKRTLLVQARSWIQWIEQQCIRDKRVGWTARVIDMARWCKRYLGLEGFPHALDAEFLDSSASTPCEFKFQTFSSEQRGDREMGIYVVPSIIEMDTCAVSRTNDPKKSAKLNKVAERLELPHKLEMPYDKLFALTEEGVSALHEYQRSGVPIESTEAGRAALASQRRVGEYCIFDSILPCECELLMDTLTETCLNGWISRTHPSGLYRRGVTWRSFCIIVCRAFADNIVVIIRPDGYTGKVDGAYMPLPKPGFYEHVFTASVDVNSLYPSIAQVHNLCWTSMILDKKHLQAARDRGLEILSRTFHGREFHFVQFVKGHPQQREGVFPKMMYFLINKRKAVKAAMKKETDPIKKGVLDQQQNSLKTQANASYGAVAFAGFKIPAKSIGAFITAGGREHAQTMEEVMNSHFPRARLLAIRDKVCARAGVPPHMWDIDAAKSMCNLGGDTDSVFWRVPVVKGDPNREVVLMQQRTWDAATGSYVEAPVRELTDADAPIVIAAKAKRLERYAMTHKERKAARKARAEALKAQAKAHKPVITEVQCFTHLTVTRKIAYALALEVCYYMVTKCFNKREGKVGRRMLDIDPDYVAERLLLLMKKNYAMLMCEDEDATEDCDRKAKQKGMPSVKADTPMFLRTMFGALVEGLQWHGLERSTTILCETCHDMIGGKLGPWDYAKLITLKDPRRMADPHAHAQTSLYLRLQERSAAGKLGDIAIPDLGMQMPLVRICDRTKTLKTTQCWEHPQWIIDQGLEVDIAFYMDLVVKKMKYLRLDLLSPLLRAALRYKIGAKNKMLVVNSTLKRVLQSSHTDRISPTDVEVAAAMAKQYHRTFEVRKTTLVQSNTKDSARREMLQRIAKRVSKRTKSARKGNSKTKKNSVAGLFGRR